jgi:hypothetical protein
VSQREREKKRGYNKDQSQKNTQKGAVCSWHDTTVQKGFSPDKQTSKRNTDPQCEPEVLTRQKQSQNAASIGGALVSAGPSTTPMVFPTTYSRGCAYLFSKMKTIHTHAGFKGQWRD